MSACDRPAPAKKGRCGRAVATSGNWIERKRESDRLAQRASRERTRERIAYLEEKVKILEDTEQNTRTSALLDRIDSLEKENAKLKEVVSKINGLSQEILTTELIAEWPAAQQPQPWDPCAIVSRPDAPKALPKVPENVPQSSSEDDATAQPTAILEEELVVAPLVHPEAAADEMMDFDLDLLGSLDCFMLPPIVSVPPAYDSQSPARCNQGNKAGELESWFYVNEQYIQGLQKMRDAKDTAKQIDLNVSFKAILWGWNAIDPEQRDHPLWTALRNVDQVVFASWTSAQRVARMLVCLLLMQYQVEPTQANLEKIPTWLRPRSTQNFIQHPLVVDFFVWPGLRDRLVFDHEKYTRNPGFSVAYTNNYHFDWPYRESEIFRFDLASGKCTFSTLFLDRVFSLDNWTMKQEFFEKYPEMREEIPVYKGEQL